MVKTLSKSHNPMRQRLDVLLVRRGFASSRDRASALIISGAVFVNGSLVIKPGKLFTHSSEIELISSGNPWVSRAGLKLAGAIKAFKTLDFSGCRVIDIGASTGGFTDVLLAHGASHVVAIDVGCGQLHDRLVFDDRVTVLDNTNARYITLQMLPYLPDMIVCDVSFISLKKLLPSVLTLAEAGTRLVALIKPQFEVGKGDVGKKGIVRSPALHQRVITSITTWLETEMLWNVLGVTPSPIAGSDGNVEFLLLAQKRG